MVELGRDPDVALGTFLDGAADPQQFWDQVDANFAAGRIKMVFVADTIPRELARIVEFLNEQMKADVRAVELAWFESANGVTALTPRIVGETERAQGEKAVRSALPALSRDAWLQEKLGPLGSTAMDAGEAFIAIVEQQGGRAEVTSTQGSIISVFNTAGGVLYPLRLSPERKGSVQLCLAYLVSRPAFATVEVRQHVYDALVQIVGPLSTATLNGYPGFDVRKLNDPTVRDAICAYLSRLVEIART